MSEVIKGVKEFYNAAAEKWANKWYADETMLPLLRKFTALLGEKPRVLDAGCGTGYESMRLANLGADVVGIDISDESIRIARERNPNCRFEIMDCGKMDDSVGLFDGIVAIGLIVHFGDSALRDLFEEFRKRLKPSGVLFTAFVEGSGFSEERSLYEINGVSYNREFYLHETNFVINTAEKARLDYIDEWHLDEPFGRWQFLVFRSSGLS